MPDASRLRRLLLRIRDERLEAPVARSVKWLAPLAIAALVLPALFRVGGPGYSLVAGLGILIGLPFWRAEPQEHRRTFLALWTLALAVRASLLVALFTASVAAGGPFLGPDSTQFLRESTALAHRGLILGTHPTLVFESYDVAHYYIYAFLIGGFGADLFSLQLFNSSLTALAAPLLYSIARRLLPGYAVALGLLVALNPSLMVLSIKDLLKDPSVLCAAAIAVWGLVRASETTRRSSLVAYLLAAVVGLSYLHMDRFYVAAYLELSAAIVLGVRVWQGRPVLRRVVVVMSIAFLMGELIPMSLGWRSLPGVMYEQVNYVLGTNAMRSADPGLAEKVLRTRVALRQGDLPPASGKKGDHIETIDEPAALARGVGVAAAVVNVIRRLFGPFVWILPTTWSARELLKGDYMLYPGTLVWYALLPFIAIGLIATVWPGLRRGEGSVPLLLLAVFCTLYFSQYVLINLSFRQRDVMFPFVAVFAIVGMMAAAQRPRWTLTYKRYWVVLAAVSILHLAFRAVILHL